MSKNKPNRTEKSMTDKTDHRILYSETEDRHGNPLRNPWVAAIIFTGTDAEAAQFVEDLGTEKKNTLLESHRRVRCTFEEILPFLREGFPIRRHSWTSTDVVMAHGLQTGRIDKYIHNPEVPGSAPIWRSQVRELLVQDILADDWEITAKPERVGSR